jgi:hypothetical protein
VKIPDGTIHPLEILGDVLAHGGAERLQRGEVLYRSVSGHRWEKQHPRSRRDLHRARQERARKLRAKSGPRVTVMSEPFGHELRLDHIRAAARILGLRQPIEIHTTTYQREHGEHAAAATHSFRDGRHVIKLDDRGDASARDLTDSLWHELVHCNQAEQDPDFRRKYTAEQARVGYEGNLYEVEANALRDELAPGMPLCR